MTKRELIQFMDELVELASEESYEYEKEVQTEITELPPYYIAAMPDAVHINAKIIMYRVANMSMYNRR